MSLTKDQRESLRSEGSLFFGSSPPYVEVRNADHTVCVKLSDMLDHMDAAEAENDALRHAFDGVNCRIGALDMTVPANKSLYEALLTALDKVAAAKKGVCPQCRGTGLCPGEEVDEQIICCRCGGHGKAKLEAPQ